MNVYQHATNRFLASRLIPVAILALIVGALFFFVGCNTLGTDETANTGDEAPTATTDSTVSKAMVLVNEDDEVFLVDQATQMPYTTSAENAVVYDIDGQQITLADLQPGNIVEVTGDGIMLESYPGQYPGITEIRVTEVGDPTDTERYADIIDQVYGEMTPIEKLSGSLQYRTDIADVSVALDPYAYKLGDLEYVGACYAEDGAILDDVVDVSVTEPTGAVLGFGDVADKVTVQRTPVLSVSEPVKVDPSEDGWQDVPLSSEDNKENSVTIEPGYLYRVTAQFSFGEGEYAFYTQIVK